MQDAHVPVIDIYLSLAPRTLRMTTIISLFRGGWVNVHGTLLWRVYGLTSELSNRSP